MSFFFRTCKPTGEPKIKLTYCLTGKGNGKSLPGAQIVIIECEFDEFCVPMSPMATLGYVFFSFWLLCFTNFNLRTYVHINNRPKPSLKIESVNKVFLFWYWQYKFFFFRNNTFLFFKIESWHFQNLFEKEFRET